MRQTVFGYVGLAILSAGIVVWGTQRISAAPYKGVDLYAIADLGAQQEVQNAAAGGSVVGCIENSNVSHAYLWSAPAGAATNLQPANLGFNASNTYGTNGPQQVGILSVAFGNTSHAVLWNGSASSAVDLNPSFALSFGSAAYGTNGVQQVGEAVTSGGVHAIVWTGTAASAIDLNPPGYNQSRAYATDGAHQVGRAGVPTADGLGYIEHAALWSGSASSFIDLQPPAYANTQVTSVAYGVAGTQQVGQANAHAFLWNGTANSAVDLEPTIIGNLDFFQSTASGTNGTLQVGWGGAMTIAHQDFQYALMWSGSASSAVNLGLLLPFPAPTSAAFAVDAQGDIFGTAEDSNTGLIHTVEWIPVPEPSALVLGTLAILLVVPFRLRKHDDGESPADSASRRHR